MPYYAGDYWTGDDYTGDNYAAGSIFSSIAGVVKGAVAGFARGGPLGAIAGARLGLPPPKAKSTALMVPTTGETALEGFVRRGGHLTKVGQKKLAGGGGMLEPGFGMHLLKRRRMNVTNVRALRRAGRRVKGFLKIARRLGALPVARGGGKKLFRLHRKKK